MNLKKASLIIFLVITLSAFIQGIYYYQQMPEKVPIHFGISGNPDSWSSKQFAVGFYLALVSFIALLFSGINWLLKKTPDDLINLPNKEFWLAKERRDDTLGIFSNFMYWIGSLTLILIIVIYHQTFQVSMGKTSALPYSNLSLLLYFLAVAIWLYLLVRRFRIPKSIKTMK